MPTKKTWLLRLTQIREELTAMDTPVIDRAVFERLFGVRRRRAIQLMHYFDGYQAGRTFLMDRLALLRQLEPLEASAEFALEQRRRQRLVESLEKVRRSRAGAACHHFASSRRRTELCFPITCSWTGVRLRWNSRTCRICWRSSTRCRRRPRRISRPSARRPRGLLRCGSSPAAGCRPQAG